MIPLLILVPALAGTVLFFLRSDLLRRAILILSAAVHLGLTLTAFIYPVAPGRWFGLDPLGSLFLAVTSILFFGAAVYAVKYLASQKVQAGTGQPALTLLHNAPEAVFSGCLLLFLSAMTAVTVSKNLGLLWAAIEATTLLSAPLIYFHRHKRSLEATWKYLLICSVGIALALMGNLFLAAAGLNVGIGLDIEALLANASGLNQSWLMAAFLFLFAGYGTKMGLAPFHTWLPDAHSEAPAVVSALLSGALLNCAFLGILRAAQICYGAGLAGFTADIFVLFGSFSLITAAFFILGQTDYKRMLAYSSIEHMGIMSLGIGLGGGAVFGALLNSVCHSLTKAGLFFLSGIVLAAYKTKNIGDVKGLLRYAPTTGILWFIGFLLITGTPPSGIFMGKFLILKETLADGRFFVAGTYLFFLAVVFAGMSRIFVEMILGEPPVAPLGDPVEHVQMLVPVVLFFGGGIRLGIYIPDWLGNVLVAAQLSVGGR